MMQRSWRTLLPLLALVAVLGYLYAQRHDTATATPDAMPGVAATLPGASASATASQHGTPTLPDFLPPEARATLALIARGGPFAHAQDGVVFGNYEHILPREPRGYYHEYTVETPGARNRGARRIITGGEPPVVYYYTDDHYRSFHAFTVPR